MAVVAAEYSVKLGPPWALLAGKVDICDDHAGGGIGLVDCG
jgi:hypothetical protein